MFAGYWGKPERDRRGDDADGWLHTGDVGEWVDGTHLRIVDRIKDIIITAGGKNISPSEIENALKISPYVKEAMVIGDRRPYLTALIGIELDTVGDWAQRRGIPYTTYRDLSEKPEVLALVQEVVDDDQRGARPRRERQAVPAAAQGARPRGRRADRHAEGQAGRHHRRLRRPHRGHVPAGWSPGGSRGWLSEEFLASTVRGLARGRSTPCWASGS